MHLLRKQDLSIYYWLKGVFQDAPFINVVDGFPKENLVLPTVALEEDVVDGTNYELGNRSFNKIRNYYIDIFTDNKTQRNEFGYKLLEELEAPIKVYDYDQGFPPTVVPALGCLNISEVSFKPIKIIPELSGSLYYRGTILFVAEYQSFGG